MRVSQNNHGLAATLFAVVATDHLGKAAGERPATRHACAEDGSFDGLMYGVIDDCRGIR